MATVLNIDTNFIGEVAGEYVGKMIKEANTISEGLVTILPNIVSTTYLRKVESSEGFVDYVCGFQPNGSITLSEYAITPKKIKWEQELCKEDFRQLWTAQEMGFSAHNDTLPATEQAAILAQMAKVVARKVDQDIWNGTLATTGDLGGLIPQLVADATVIDVVGAVITSANVEAELGKFVDAVPDEVIGAADLILGVSTNVLRALKKVQGSFARSNGTFSNPSEFDFNGYTLTEVKALPANIMVAYAKSNVTFITGLLADHNEIRIKDMDESDLSGQIRMKVVLTGAIGYAFGAEIVLYKTV
jgi:hypothetical protein